MPYYYEVMFQYSINQVPQELLTVGSVEMPQEVPADKINNLLPSLQAKYGKPGSEIKILRPVSLTKDQYENFTDHFLPVDRS